MAEKQTKSKKELGKETKPEKKADKSTSVKLAVIRVRGCIRLSHANEDTLNMLKLYRKNYLVILNKTPSMIGMIKKVKDYITWGEVSPEVIKLVEEKRGEKDPKDNSKLKKYFRLAPPRKGFERKGIKTPYNLGGALGYRGDDMNNLIKKML